MQLDALEVSKLVLLLLVMSAVVLDFLCYRISNRLIAAGMMLALVLGYAQGGVQQMILVLRNMSFPVIVLYLFYRMRAIGAGDVKLFSMIGGFLNFRQIVWCMGISFVIGAVLSLGKMLRNGTLYRGLLEGGSYIWGLMGGKWQEYLPSGDTKDHVIHFSLAILLGMLAVLIGGTCGSL